MSETDQSAHSIADKLDDIKDLILARDVDSLVFTPDVKPGYKSTEFLIVAVIAIGNSIIASGIFSPESDALKITTSIVSGLAAVAYTVSRTYAKR